MEVTKLEEELAEMKSKLESIESNITEYKRQMLEYELKNEKERAKIYLTLLDREWENKKSLESRIDKAEGKLSELRESMGKKARMIQEGMLMPIPALILLFSIHNCLQIFLLYLAFNVLINRHQYKWSSKYHMFLSQTIYSYRANSRCMRSYRNCTPMPIWTSAPSWTPP